MAKYHFVNPYDSVLMGHAYQRPDRTYTIDPDKEISDEDIKKNEFLQWWFFVAPSLKDGDIVRIIETDTEGRHFDSEQHKVEKREVPHNLISRLYIEQEPPMKPRYYVKGLDNKYHRFGMLDRTCEKVIDKKLRFQCMMGGSFVDE